MQQYLSLIVAHWQRSFLAICACYKLLTLHCTRETAGAIVCNVHCIFVDSPLTLWLSLIMSMCYEHLMVILNIQYFSVLVHRGFCTIVLHLFWSDVSWCDRLKVFQGGFSNTAFPRNLAAARFQGQRLVHSPASRLLSI